jgi:hypothetical protein
VRPVSSRSGLTRTTAGQCGWVFGVTSSWLSWPAWGDRRAWVAVRQLRFREGFRRGGAYQPPGHSLEKSRTHVRISLVGLLLELTPMWPPVPLHTAELQVREVQGG